MVLAAAQRTAQNGEITWLNHSKSCSSKIIQTMPKMILHELNRSGFETTSRRVDTEAAFLASLNGGLDLILCDHTMPEFSGLRALELLKTRSLEIPFIIVSGTIGEEMAGGGDEAGRDGRIRSRPAGAVGRRSIRPWNSSAFARSTSIWRRS